MAPGIRIGSAVIFVEQLTRSVSFYREVLGLEVTDQSPTAALLTSPGGAQLYLRAMGATAAHPLGGVGVQYVTWVTAGEDELDRCERALRGRSAFRDRRRMAGVTVVEGRDPDGVAVMLSYPGPEESPVSELPSRIYGW